MQFSDRRKILVSGAQPPGQTMHMGFKFAQRGRYLIAAGSKRPAGQLSFDPVLYISIAGGKGWATHYPLDSKFAKDHEAAAAAMSYGMQIIDLEVKDILPPQDPLRLVMAADEAVSAPRLIRLF